MSQDTLARAANEPLLPPLRDDEARERRRFLFSRWHLVLFPLAILMVIPLAWMLVTSLVVLETFVVFVIIVPWGTLALTCTIRVKVATDNGPTVPLLAVNVPVFPTAGLDKVNAWPEVCMADTKVVFAGITSERVTPWASIFWPPFPTMIV